MRIVLLLAIAFVAILARPFDVETLHQVRRIGDFTANSAGDVVYSVREWDPTTKKTTTNLQILYSESDNPYTLTYSEGSADSQPQFSPDEAFVLFLSNRGGSSQVYIVPVNGTEDNVVQLSNFSIDVDNYKVFVGQDIWFIMYTMSVYPDCSTLQCTADRDAAVQARGPNTWRYYTQLFVRHWDSWETGKASHIFVQKFVQNNNQWVLAGDPLDLMPGMAVTSPVPPFGGLEQIDISPDGGEIAFTAVPQVSSSAWTTGWKIYIVPTDGSAPPTSITDYTQARTTNPRYSPDGTSIAFLSMDRPGFEADRLHITTYQRDTAAIFQLTPNLDISFNDIQFTPDGSFLIGDADYFGNHSLFPIPYQQGVAVSSATALPLNGTNENVMFIPGSNLMIYTSQSMSYPVQLYTLPFNTTFIGQQPAYTYGQATLLTNENDDILMDIDFSSAIRFSFKGSNGDTVYGWVVPPYGLDTSKKYPVAHLVHGGPQGNWGDDWSYRWNPQLWAGHGYGVIMVDFHGSTGYGQAFTDSISGNWGSLPYWDVMNGTFAALQQFPWLDGTRVGALGASYGGFMINWIHGHTDFFKALVTHDGIFDTVSAYYTTEELWFPEWEFRGTPWKNAALYQQWNPANFVDNWKVPHLIIHGGHDYRLTLSQGLGAFTVLQRKGIPSAFLEFDLENHWVLNDSNGIKWYQTVLGWLDQYVAGSGKPTNQIVMN